MSVANVSVLFVFSCQWSVVVTYAAGGQDDNDIVQVNVAVLDINEAPLVDVTAGNVTVAENASIGFVVFTLNVTDPDARTANGSAVYKNITAVSMILKCEFRSCVSETDIFFFVLSLSQCVCLSVLVCVSVSVCPPACQPVCLSVYLSA